MGDSIVFAFKIAAAVAVATVFLGVIITITSILINYNFSAPNVFSEVIGLISVYLPFNPAEVFGTFIMVSSSILAFLIGRKVYQLTNNIWRTA